MKVSRSCRRSSSTITAITVTIVAMRMEDKDAQIADLTRQLGQKDLAASQCAQNAYLISQLHPSPIPAFNVPNPNATVGYGCYCNQA